MKLFLQLFWNEWKANKLKFLLFSLSLSLGIAAVSGVGTFGEDVKKALKSNARILLGADLEISDVQVIDSRVAETLEKELEILPTQKFVANKLLAMASQLKSASNMESKLVDVFAFEGAFPLVPETLKVTPVNFQFSSLKAGHIAIDSSLATLWNLSLGSTFQLIGETFQVQAIVDEDLSRDGGVLGTGIRVYISRKDAQKIGLLSNTSRFRESIFLLLPKNLSSKALEEKIKTLVPKNISERLRFLASDDENRTSQRLLRNLQYFLSQVSLSTLLLIGLGVCTCLQEVVRLKARDIAILRTLGATPKVAVGMIFFTILSLIFLSSVTGIILGEIMRSFVLAPQLAKLFPVAFQTFSLTSVPLGIPVVCVLAPILFLMPSFLQLREVSAASVLRNPDLNFNFLGTRTKILASLCWLTGSGLTLSLFVLNAQSKKAGFALFLVNLVLFFIFAFCLKGILNMASKRLQLPLSWKIALGELNARKTNALLTMALIGIGSLFLSVINILKTELAESLKENVSASQKPNLFFIDVQKNQAVEMEKKLFELTNLKSDSLPMLRARLTKLNGIPIEQQEKTDSNVDSGQMRNREQNLTWKHELGEFENISEAAFEIKGKRLWQNEQFFEQKPEFFGQNKESLGQSSNFEVIEEVSLEERFASRIGAKMNDTLEFSVLGFPIQAKVTSLRKVQWQSLRPNFFVVLHPSLLKKAPHQVLLSTHSSSRELSSQIQNTITKLFPNVSTIDVSSILTRLQELSVGIVNTTQGISLLLLLAGLLILASSLFATKGTRRKNYAVLRTLGASNKNLRESLVIEFLVVGGLASFLGVSLAQGVSFVMLKQFLEIEPQINAMPWFLSWFGFSFVTLAIGYLTCRSVLKEKPLKILREAQI